MSEKQKPKKWSKEWCLNKARLENGAEIGAGILALDPVSDAMLKERGQDEH